MSVNKIEGVPDGWEVVRIGKAKDGEWYLNGRNEPILCDGYETLGGGAIVRKIEPPKPTYIPWTYETCPIGCVVRRKNGLENVSMVVAKTDISAGQAGCYYLYSQLFEHWEQLDGTPCGTVQP